MRTNVVEIADPSLASPAIYRTSPDLFFRKRNIERACDACRRRKTKCDGPRMPDNICTNCIQSRKTCSYVEASKPRSPPRAYITSMEDRVEKMEALLKRLRPEADLSEELGPPVIRNSWKTNPELPCRMLPHQKSTLPSAPCSRRKSSTNAPCSRSIGTLQSGSDTSSDDYSSSDSEEVGELSLSRGMKRLTIRGLEPTQDHCSLADSQVRFHGKSSCFKLIEPTRKLRDEHVNRMVGGEGRSPSARDGTSPINAAVSRRPEFWTTPPWELAFEGFQNRLENLSFSISEDFPPQDLADSLIKLFFENINPFTPLLHRPTFERQWREGLQHEDAWFGCLCLSMFAVASRWSDDPRVLDDGKYDVFRFERPIEKHKWQRAGWRFFDAAVDVHRASLSLFHPAGLYEIQTMALLGVFLRGTAFHPEAWLFVSIGLRKAQDVGAHRKKIYGDKPSVEGELWKRSFWVLVLLDRMASASLGRPCCSGEEDFDAELPLEVDDEYWERDGPEKAFQQPPGQPSKIAAFNSHLKLTKIVAYAMRTIYALDRTKLFSTVRPRWQRVLAQLNREMTEWVDSVPKHLRWSPHIEDSFFSNQAATLYITYHLIQIIIYRPFLPPSLHSAINITPHANMPIPCIAVCVNAGKSVSRILKVQIARGYPNIPTTILGSHVCAAVLLMNFWDLKWQKRNQMGWDDLQDTKSPLAQAMAELLEEISVFVEALEGVKLRWRSAEIYLNDLSSSFPRSLGGYEPSLLNNDSFFSIHLPKFGDHTYHATPDYATHADHRNPPSEYRIAPPQNITTPLERGPQFFEFPHITRYPVPSTLPLLACPASHECDQSMTTRVTAFQSQRDHDGFTQRPEPGDGKSSSSSAHPRPASLALDGTLINHYTTPSRASLDGSVSASTHPSVTSTSALYQTIPGWASDWNHDPTYTSGSSSDDAAVQPGYLTGDTTSPHGQVLSFSGGY